MARADYIGCEVCDGKGLYDGYWDIRDREEISVAVLCPRCKLTHDLKAVEKTSEPESDSEEASL